MDRRLIIGTPVKAKASQVCNKAECRRRFGPTGPTTEVYGIVLEVVRIPNPKTGRFVTAIKAEYDLHGNYKKTVTLNIRSIIDATDDPSRPGYHIPNRQIDNNDNNPVVTEAENIDITEDDNNNLNNNPDFIDISNQRIVDLNSNDNAIVNAAVAAAEAAILDTTTALQPSTPTAVQPSTPTTNRPVTRLMLSPERQNLATTVHNTHWFHEPMMSLNDINGPFPARDWGIRSPTDDILRAGTNSDEHLSRLDVFLLMMPPAQLELMVYCTNKQLTAKNKRETTRSEILKLIGVIVLMTKHQFKSRGSLWSNVPPSKYESAPNFGKTGMSKHRFDDLWSCLRFAYQPPQRPEHMTSERYRWLLCDNFVENFNRHRARNFIPSERICVDESISRWYGQGGDWINKGLPMYVAIDRKPENGCEIQDACCGQSGIMLQIKLVKTSKESKAIEEEKYARLTNQQFTQTDRQLLHGIKVMKELIEPWNFTHRVVCADSYFYASVAAAEELMRYRFRFIGVVKTATKRFPMKHLSGLVMPNRGDRYPLLKKDVCGTPDMMAFVWVDRGRRYFVATGSSMQEGDAYFRHRWRQVNREDDNADPERVELELPIPKAAELYYQVCGKIDQHNRDRQDTLGIERKLKTNDWSLRVNLSILSMIIVDSWKAYCGLTFGNGGLFDDDNTRSETQKDFYGHLAAELIDNTYDNVGGTGARRSPEAEARKQLVCPNTGDPRAGQGPHLTPTRRKRRDRYGNETNQMFQGHCRVCTKKTSHVCSVCKDDPNIKDEGWICYSKTKRDCFDTHMNACH